MTSHNDIERALGAAERLGVTYFHRPEDGHVAYGIYTYNPEVVAVLSQGLAWLRQLLDENRRLQDNYNDLIYQVGSKFPNETRHETAKRYITEQERGATDCDGGVERPGSR